MLDMPNNTDSVSLLLLGGGYVLSRLAEQIEPERFVITTRSSEKLAHFRQRGFFAEQVDYLDESSLVELFRRYTGIRTVIDSIPPDMSDVDPLRGARQLQQICERQQLERFFYLSTTGVYGVTDGSWVTEDTLCAPKNQRSQLRYDTEKLYLESSFPTTLFRLSGIYGPGRGVGLSLKAGTYRLLEDGSRFTNRIHVDDITASLLTAWNHSGDLPSCFNVSDNDPAPMAEVIDYYVTRFSLPQPQTVSKDEVIKEGGSRLLLNQRIKNDLLRKSLQYSLRYPTYREGAGCEFASG